MRAIYFDTVHSSNSFHIFLDFIPSSIFFKHNSLSSICAAHIPHKCGATHMVNPPKANSQRKLTLPLLAAIHVRKLSARGRKLWCSPHLRQECWLASPLSELRQPQMLRPLNAPYHVQRTVLIQSSATSASSYIVSNFASAVLPEPWRKGVWYLRPVYGWALHRHRFTVLWPVMGFCINHHSGHEVSLTSESCTNGTDKSTHSTVYAGPFIRVIVTSSSREPMSSPPWLFGHIYSKHFFL